jgi:cytochrome c oxidase assembly factor CtaG
MSESARALSTWNWEPSVLLGLALIIGAYLAALGPSRSRFRSSAPVERARVFAFLLGAFVMLFALVSPLDDIGDRYLFSAHMTQHLLLTLVAPPLMLIGTPGWMLRPLLRDPVILRAARFFTTPLIAFALFNVDFLVWHLPALYDATLHNQMLHIFEHLLFIVTAFLNWSPILSPLPELPRLPAPAQILYLFGQALPATILGAFIVFAPAPLMPTYAAAPPIFGINALNDQQFSGLIMWMPGGMVYLLALSIVWFTWIDGEERAERTPVPR